jgi:hypothetical protein
MSVEIIDTFTSGKNIDYLRDYLNENIKDEEKKQVVLDNLIEDIFNFPDIGSLNNTRERLRQSIDIREEVGILNKAFIDNKLAFVREMDDMGEESYEMNMFASEMAGYAYLNNWTRKTYYNNRGHYETNNDELDESELSQVRSYFS